MIDRSGPVSGDVRQRWRIVFAREAPALELGGDAIGAAWAEAVRASGLPVTGGGASGSRRGIAFAAPLAAGVPAEHELLDLGLSARVTAFEVRTRLGAGLPAGIRLVAAFDVWVGAQALPASLAAADHRLAVRGAAGPELAAAADSLLAAAALPRERAKGEGRSVRYDLRPLLADVRLLSADDRRSPAVEGIPVLAMRLLHPPGGGAGRPDEVVRALGERLGRPLEIAGTVRERLWTRDELPGATPRPSQV